jgi:PadR family transcriptional regulator PadR
MAAITSSVDQGVARPSALLRDVVLLTIAAGPCHGYQLAQALGDWRPANIGQFYRLLRQLEVTGLVHSTWTVSPGGPARRVYSLTPTGEEAVRECAAVLGRLGVTLECYARHYRALGRSPAVVGPATTGRSGRRPRPAELPSADHRTFTVSVTRDSTAVTGAGHGAIRCYLEILEARRRPTSPDAGDHEQIAALDARLDQTPPFASVQLRQRRPELGSAPALAGDEHLEAAESAFIAVARPYSEAEGITYAAWREVGVEARVLLAAGVAPTTTGPPISLPHRERNCPQPLLRAWLLLLVAERPCHGYQLGEALVAMGVGPVDASRVYRLLHRLHDESLVSSRLAFSDLPAPNRRLYSLTSAGEEALDACAAGVASLHCGLPRPDRSVGDAWSTRQVGPTTGHRIEPLWR